MRQVPALTGLAARLRDLLDAWDPLGVIALGAPADEYDCLIPQLASLIDQHSDAERFAEYLALELARHFAVEPGPDLGQVARQLADLSGVDAGST